MSHFQAAQGKFKPLSRYARLYKNSGWICNRPWDPANSWSSIVWRGPRTTDMELTGGFIVNHLWQSSCFVLLAALLAFVLRKNSPKVRYWVWLGASLKFLMPLALLVNLGS